MNIQFVRLEEDVCQEMNARALAERRTVSELVNEILRAHLEGKKDSRAADCNPI